MPKIVDHDQRRDSIAKAACEVIASVPLDRLTLRDIANAAGYTTGAVSHYFADKDEVLTAALDWVFRAREQRLQNEFKTGQPDLRQILCQHLPLDHDRVVESRVMCAFIGKVYADERLSAVRRSRALQLHDFFQRALEFCRDAGLVAQGIDLEKEAELLLDLIMGISMRTSLDPERWPPNKQIEHLDAYLERLGIKTNDRSS
jgi:TetR/AcrR family transcriptional repressor of bet genes